MTCFILKMHYDDNIIWSFHYKLKSIYDIVKYIFFTINRYIAAELVQSAHTKTSYRHSKRKNSQYKEIPFVLSHKFIKV